MFCLSSPSAFKIPQYWLALLYIYVSLIFLFLSKFLPHCLLVSVALFSLVSVFRLSLRAVCLLSWIFWFLWVFWTSLDLICNLVIFHQVSPLQSDLPLFHQPFGKGSERSLFAAPHCFCKAQVENSILQLWKLLSFTVKKKIVWVYLCWEGEVDCCWLVNVMQEAGEYVAAELRTVFWGLADV